MNKHTVGRKKQSPPSTRKTRLTQKLPVIPAPDFKAGLRHTLEFLEVVDKERVQQLKIRAILNGLYTAWLNSDDDDGITNADQVAVVRTLLKDSMERTERAQMELEKQLDRICRRDDVSDVTTDA